MMAPVAVIETIFCFLHENNRGQYGESSRVRLVCIG
ncbi:hypothetical protein EC12264_A0056 [Escherichia coli 1.2264]|nr:hypothetical protein EC12264_A0056 [Escherichia coli 1.2264]